MYRDCTDDFAVYFAIFNACFLPLVYFFYPETQNLSLEQIDRLFTGPKVVLHIRHAVGGVDDVSPQSSESDAVHGKDMMVDRLDKIE